MSITADHLRQLGAKNRHIEDVVKEQLQIIDTLLLRAEKTLGKNKVAYELPAQILVPGLDKQNSQLVIYSRIIDSLTLRGFKVKIRIEENNNILLIYWMADLGKAELKAMYDNVYSRAL